MYSNNFWEKIISIFACAKFDCPDTINKLMEESITFNCKFCVKQYKSKIDDNTMALIIFITTSDIALEALTNYSMKYLLKKLRMESRTILFLK